MSSEWQNNTCLPMLRELLAGHIRSYAGYLAEQIAVNTQNKVHSGRAWARATDSIVYEVPWSIMPATGDVKLSVFASGLLLGSGECSIWFSGDTTGAFAAAIKGIARPTSGGINTRKPRRPVWSCCKEVPYE